MRVSVCGAFEICLIINSLCETKAEKLSMHRYVCSDWVGVGYVAWGMGHTSMYGHESMAHGY